MVNMFHEIVSTNSIVQLAIQIKNGIMINSSASIKSIVRAKKIIVRFLAHVYVRKANI